MHDLAGERRRFGYWRLHILLDQHVLLPLLHRAAQPLRYPYPLRSKSRNCQHVIPSCVSVHRPNGYALVSPEPLQLSRIDVLVHAQDERFSSKNT